MNKWMHWIRVSLHPLFLCSVVLSLWFGYVVEFLIGFVIVILHECGHLLAARSVGWQVKELRLLPFGGELVITQRCLTTAREEIFVALAGPFVNALLISGTLIAHSMQWTSADASHYFIQANIWIALFNLLPAMPLDGGKVLTALLSLHLSYHKTQWLMCHFSLAISFCLFAISLISTNMSGIHFNLLVVSLFLLYVNLSGLRQLPYIMLRFLLQKKEFIEKIENEESERDMNFRRMTVFVQVSDGMSDIVKNIMRERRHCFFVMNEQQMVVKVIEEMELLGKYFSVSGESR